MARKRDLTEGLDEEREKFKVVKKIIEEVHDMIIECKLIMYDLQDGEKYKKDITIGFKELQTKLQTFEKECQHKGYKSAF